MPFISLLEFWGKMHPLWVHLPIGFILLLLFFSVFFYKRKSKTLTRLLRVGWGITFISSLLTALMGLALSQSNYYFPITLSRHAFFGWFLSGLTFLAWLLHNPKWPTLSKWKPPVYGLTTIVLLLAGHFGGNLTHGENYLFDSAQKTIVPSSNKTLANLSKDSILVYEDLIQPIFNNKCVACHNSVQAFGGLNMEQGAFLTNTSDKHNFIIPQKPYESSLFKRVVLPQDHPKFMPPTGTPLKFDEILLLEWWIASGAKKREPLSDISKDAKVTFILDRYYQIPSKERAWYEKSILPPLAQEQQDILEQNNFQWRYLATNNTFIEVRFLGTKIESNHLQILTSLQDHITWLNLSNVALNDSQMETLATFKNLSRLHLQQNPITEMGLSFLVDLPHLQMLTLYETAISDAALPILSSFSDLKFVSFWNTNLSPTSLNTFKTQNPNIKVVGH